MNQAAQFLEILKYILPSVVVFFTTWYLAGRYFKHENQKNRQQIEINTRNIITPLRLQAYERIILYLERINPENLVMRLNNPNLNCQQLQNEMLTTVRAEYEHNFTQQIYISNKAWEMLKNAKNATIQLINIEADKISKDAPAVKLSRAILEKIVEEEKNPVSDAMMFIKKEVASFFL